MNVLISLIFARKKLEKSLKFSAVPRAVPKRSGQPIVSFYSGSTGLEYSVNSFTDFLQ